MINIADMEGEEEVFGILEMSLNCWNMDLKTGIKEKNYSMFFYDALQNYCIWL